MTYLTPTTSQATEFQSIALFCLTRGDANGESNIIYHLTQGSDVSMTLNQVSLPITLHIPRVSAPA